MDLKLLQVRVGAKYFEKDLSKFQHSHNVLVLKYKYIALVPKILKYKYKYSIMYLSKVLVLFTYFLCF